MQKISIASFAARGSRGDLARDIERVAIGDVDAFIRVYHATSAKLFGVVVRILGRGDLTEEVLQEVYLRIWQRASDFDAARASPITWLATIARNRALDEGRRRRMSSLEDMPELLEVPSDEDIAENHLASEELRRLQTGLGRLPPDQRKVVELVYFEGLTRDQVAQRMGRTTATVNCWLRSGLKQLKGVLQP
jgi:RNA polymerase sigma-70 factor, ECF subfamily